MSDLKVVRSKSAGVFYGTVLSSDQTPTGHMVTMSNARRLWYWDGASSLSQLAMEGVRRPLKCKFPCKVSKVELFEVVEILDMTDAAVANLDAVPVWEQ
jgi:hypothetical protein